MKNSIWVKSSFDKTILHSATSPQRKSGRELLELRHLFPVFLDPSSEPAATTVAARSRSLCVLVTVLGRVNMTNQLVGAVYAKIIDELIDQSAVSFEEDGVNHSVLDDLKKTWQHKLTVTKCASFPWDPAPLPPLPQPMVTPAPVPSNVPRTQQGSSSGSPALSSNANGSNNIQVKEEPSYMSHGLPSGIQSNYGNPLAQQRAAQALQQKFGTTANAQVAHLQNQAAMSQQGRQQHQPNPQNIQLPPQMSEQQRQYLEQASQRQMQARQMQQSQQRPQAPNAPVSSAQTDGAGEWDVVVSQHRAAARDDPDSSISADLTIRQQLEESSRAMEGGGLMLPLSEQSKRQPARKQKTHAAKSTNVSQFDGPNDSDEDTKGVKREDLGDEDDEDAINSDLDDPDDDVVEEDGDDSNQGQIMLCTYDKVQRVKNKWKCVLKDGILTTGGKE
ncbi:MAG: hypothetical protein Q9169_001070 [Polycauliona sp. 2 TL-2023]